MKFTLNLFLIVLSAFLVSSAFFTLSFLKVPFGTMMPFALIPLFIGTQKIVFASKNQKLSSVLKKSILSIWFFGFLVQLISFFWISKPIIYFGGVTSYLAYPLYVFICLLSSTYFIILFSPYIASLCIRKNSPNNFIFILPVALSMTLFEIIIPRFFDWSFGGLLSSNLVFSQLESLFGFNTGSLFIFYISLLIASMTKENRKKVLTYALSILFFVTLFGYSRLVLLNKSLNESKHFRVAFVQPNFTFSFLSSLPLPSHDSQIQSFSRMMEMSQEVIAKSVAFDGKKPNIIVWPESTAPDSFLLSSNQIQAVRKLSKNYGMPFLIQALEIYPKDIAKFGYDKAPLWSSSVVVNEGGLEPQFFQKWIPMPFGEEFPLESKLPILGSWYRAFFKNASKIERGISYKSLPLNQNTFVTPLICFDTIDQELSYMSTKKGNASFFVNQANFVWMVDSNAGLELSLLDQMRAIENGRSVVVASNTGPSLAFDASGKILLPPTKLLTQNINFVDIPLYRGKTLFQTVYKWPLVILGILSVCYLIYKARKSFLYAKQIKQK